MSEEKVYAQSAREAAFKEYSIAAGYLEMAESVQETTFNPDGFYARAHFYVLRSAAFWRAHLAWNKAKSLRERVGIQTQLIHELAYIRENYMISVKSNG